ncbi:hypothetical protein PBI_SCTP2_513 [Salicola phage SCTP-2]|nr:hypothetical protein PBI_SCTP2_513 [Salicola phage SCTP-2]
MGLKMNGIPFRGQFKVKKAPSNIIENPNVYATGYDNNSVYKIDSLGNELWAFSNHTDSVRALAVDIEGNVYSGSDDNTVRKIDSSGSELWVFSKHTSSVESVAVDQNGNVYSGSRDNTVRKLDSTGNELWKYETNNDRIWGIAVDPGTVDAGFWT